MLQQEETEDGTTEGYMLFNSYKHINNHLYLIYFLSKIILYNIIYIIKINNILKYLIENIIEIIIFISYFQAFNKFLAGRSEGDSKNDLVTF